MKTWAEDFEPRFRDIPFNRKAENVRALRALIKDMYEADFGVAEMGRLLNRDHTTIIHHLWVMGFRPRQEQREKSVAYLKLRIAEQKALRKARPLRKKLMTERVKSQVQAALLYQQSRAQVAKRKAQAKALYTKGVPIAVIAQQMGVSIGSVHYYVHYDGTVKKRLIHTPVVQMDLVGTVIKVYPSIRAAALATGIDAGNIAHAVNDRRYNQSGGYIWKKVADMRK